MTDFSIFNNEVFITLFLSGIIIWLIGLYILKRPPKFPNISYGYRTQRAKASREAWDYAQLHGTKRMIMGAQAMLVLSFVSLKFNFSETVGSIIAVAFIIVLLTIPIIITERDLKEKFG